MTTTITPAQRALQFGPRMAAAQAQCDAARITERAQRDAIEAARVKFGAAVRGR